MKEGKEIWLDVRVCRILGLGSVGTPMPDNDKSLFSIFSAELIPSEEMHSFLLQQRLQHQQEE